MSQCGLGCAYLDLAPRYSSLISTIGNFFCSVAGIAGPLMVARLTEDYPGAWGWRWTFIVTAALCYMSIALWMLYQSSTVVPELNNPPTVDDDEL